MNQRMQSKLFDAKIRQSLKSLFDAAQPPSWVWEQLQQQTGQSPENPQNITAETFSFEPAKKQELFLGSAVEAPGFLHGESQRAKNRNTAKVTCTPACHAECSEASQR